jgi:glycerol uptake facilitator-like aquaporin
VIASVCAEALGSAFLLAIVVVSGIMGEKLADGNAGVTLIANSLATGAGLFTLISIFAPISGAHFNPAVTIAAAIERRLSVSVATAYVLGQLVGAYAGVLAAHAMFRLPLVQVSAHARETSGEFLGEVLATFGLFLTIRLLVRAPLAHVVACVALWIVGAYWFTSSTSFANPAVTVARSLTNTFAGIAPSNVAAFVAAQFVGVGLAIVISRILKQR